MEGWAEMNSRHGVADYFAGGVVSAAVVLLSALWLLWFLQ